MSTTEPEAGAQHMFAEFPPATLEDWQREAERGLKPGQTTGGLAHTTLEGWQIQPIYGPQPRPGHVGGRPGQSPFVRGAAPAPGWSICQELAAPTPAAWAEQAAAELAGGGDALCMRLDRVAADPAEGLSLATVKDLDVALEPVDLSRVPLVLEPGLRAPAVAAMLFAAAQKKGVALAQLQGSLGFDPLVVLAAEGRLPAPPDRLFDLMADLVTWCAEYAPGLVPIVCHADPYHDAGGHVAQELAFTLASAAEYLAALVERGVEPDVAARAITFRMPVGSRLLVEIAKLRAARLLWDAVAGAFGCSPDARAARIHACTSRWNATGRDVWVNLLRCTVESFVATVGGAQRLTVAPHDAAIGPSDGFSRRIARNTQLILREESFAGKVIDPAGGSWAIEALTDQVGREAWALVQEVERRGGMLQAILAGFPQAELEATAGRRRAAIARRAEPFVGVSSYADPDEPMPQAAEHPRATPGAGPTAEGAALTRLRGTRGAARLDAAIQAAGQGATLDALWRALGLPGDDSAVQAPAISAWRGSAAFEALRDAADAYRRGHGDLPPVFVVGVGSTSKLRARLDWVAGALRAGGFRVLGNEVLPTDAAAEAAIGSGAAALVVCAADEDYPELVPKVVQGLGKGRAKIAALALAGPPPQGEPPWVRTCGVDLFLHRKTDLVAALGELQRKAGVAS